MDCEPWCQLSYPKHEPQFGVSSTTHITVTQLMALRSEYLSPALLTTIYSIRSLGSWSYHHYHVNNMQFVGTTAQKPHDSA